MSVKVMSWVWQHSSQSGNARLVMLAIADFANDEGVAWPAMESLAKKASVSERTAQRIVNQLVESGDLAIKRNEGPNSCNLYIVTGCQESTPAGKKQFAKKKPAKPKKPDRAAPSTETGVRPDPAEVLVYFTEKDVPHPDLETDSFMGYWDERDWCTDHDDPKKRTPITEWKRRAATWAMKALKDPSFGSRRPSSNGVMTYQQALRYAQERGTGDIQRFFDPVPDEHGGKPKWRLK